MKTKLEEKSRHSLFNRISVRFVSFVILVTLLAGGIISIVAITTSKNTIRQEILDNTSIQAQLAAEFTANYMEVIQANLETFATRPLLVDYIVDNNMQAATRMLEQFVQIQSVLDSSGLYSIDGIQLAIGVPSADTVGQSFADREWFQQVIATRQPFQSAPIKSRATGNTIVVYTVPILDEHGQLIGVLAAGISLEKLSTVITKINNNPSISYSILDLRNDGLIIAHRDKKLIMTSVSESYSDILTLISTGASGGLEVTSNTGKNDLVGFAPTPNLPWGVIIVTPAKTAFVSVKNLTQTSSILSVIIVLIAAMMGALFVLQITRPLQFLVKETKEVGKGNLDYLIKTTNKGEIGDLSRSFKDMTENLKKLMVSNELLTTSEEKYRLLITQMTQGVALHEIIVDDAGKAIDYRFLDVNPGFEKLTGLKREDILGKTVLEVLPGTEEYWIERYGNVAMTGESLVFENYAKELEKHYEVIVYSPKLKQFATIFNDITDRRRLEAEKIESANRNQQQQRLESIGTLAAGVAHEINNPINGIMNYGQLIFDSLDSDSENTEFAKEIIHETNRISTIVKNLLQFSRDNKKEYSLANIKDIIESTLSLIRTVIKHDQIELLMDIPEELPKLKCRSQQIQQVIMNLLTNSRDTLNEKYQGYHENKIIKLYCKQFNKENRRWIRISIEDHGNGIPEDIQEKIFEPFFTSKSRATGTGLGLSISYGIVKDHHGELTFETKEGQYTKFYLDLPVDNGWELEN